MSYGNTVVDRSDLRPIASGTAKQQTLTDKAQRVAQMSNELRGLTRTIHGRIVPADKPLTDGVEPNSDHALFALESAERALGEAIATSHSTLDAL